MAAMLLEPVTGRITGGSRIAVDGPAGSELLPGSVLGRSIARAATKRISTSAGTARAATRIGGR
jgi:hypothetical protein